jgi:hypothetical protein
VDSELDLTRLDELQQLLGTERAAIVDTLLSELGTALDDVAAGLAAGDLEAVAAATHAARNSALMIDAQPLLTGLGELESCARHEDLVAALAANRRLRRTWPRLRRRLELAASGP